MDYPKFIIETLDQEGDCLIVGECTYHKELATDIKKVKGGGVENNLVDWFDNTYGKMTKKEIETAIVKENKKFNKLKKENSQLPYHYESAHIQNIQFLNRRLTAIENKKENGGGILDLETYGSND